MEAQLKSKGWYFTSDGLVLCKEGLVNPSVDTITQRALDIDLRSISSGCPDHAARNKSDIQGPLILQIQKIRNVAAPKMNEDSSYAPKLLRIQLTDGNNFHSGLLLHSIPKIDMNTPPGTKVLIKGKLTPKQGLLLLDQNNTKVLGGHVDEMVERWKLAKTLSQFTRASKVEGAPPPWVPFGQRKKMDSSQRNDHSFKGGKKSLETNQKEVTESDKAFEEQRKAAIQGAGKHQSKKFGGGKAVPSNIDRLNEHRRAQGERQDGTRVAPPSVNRPQQSQGIYRELSSDSNKPDEGDVQKLTSMGFGREACISALKKNNGNVDSAVETLLNGAADDVGPASRDSHPYRGHDRRDGGRDFDSRRGGYDSRRGGMDSRRGGHISDSRPGGRNFDPRGRDRGSDSRRRRGGDDDYEDEEYSSQPSGGTTLFDFLESKLAKDHPSRESGNSGGGGQRSRNYAKEQPPSVREAGIKFVHQGTARDDEKKDGRPERGLRDNRPSRSVQNDRREEKSNSREGQSEKLGRHDSREGKQDSRSGQNDNHRGQNEGRDPRNDSRGGHYDSRGGQYDSRGGQNDRSNPRRTEGQPQSDRGPGRPRGGSAQGPTQNSQRNTQYTLPPRFQKLQEAENKRGGPNQSSRQDDKENRRVGRTNEDKQKRDNGPKRNSPQRSSSQRSNGPHRNNGPSRSNGPQKDPPQEKDHQRVQDDGPQVNGDGGPGTYRLQQRPQQNPQPSQQPNHQPNHQLNPEYEGGNPDGLVRWSVGDVCIAKYWEDNGFYNASIMAIHPSGKTCVVHFMEYGNQEEVLTSDIFPLPNQPWGAVPPPHQFPPPNHIMVPQPFPDTRNMYNRGPQQRYIQSNAIAGYPDRR